MSLRTVSFQDTYWSGENDLIKEFYVPCMERVLNTAALSDISTLPSCATSPTVCIPLFKTADGCVLSAV